jgi:hypothetical protein
LIVDTLGTTTSKLGCSLDAVWGMEGERSHSLLLKKKPHMKLTNKRMPWLRWLAKCESGVKEKKKKELMACGCLLFKEYSVLI